MLCPRLQSPHGRKLILDHRHTRNARSVLWHLQDHCQYGTAARLRRQNLNHYLVTLRLDGSYKKSQATFLSQFDLGLQRYNLSALNSDEMLSDNIAKIYLQMAVYDAPNLRAVSTREAQDMAHGTTPLSYTQYLHCLNTAATLHDSTSLKITSINSTSVANDTATTAPSSDTDGSPSSDSPSDPGTLVNASHSSRPMLPPNLFQTLSNDGKRAWSQFPESDRAALVNAIPRQVNHTDMHSDFSSITGPPVPTPPPAPDPVPPPAATAPLSANNTVTQDSNAATPVARGGRHPADPRRLLSQSSKPAPKATATKVSTVRFQPPDLSPSDVESALQQCWASDDDVWHDAQDF